MNEKIYKLLHEDSSGKQRFLSKGNQKLRVSLFVSEMEAREEYNEFFVKNNS